MKQKEIKPSALKSSDPNPKLVEEQMESSYNMRKAILLSLAREKRIQEASKPLYLKRYE